MGFLRKINELHRSLRQIWTPSPRQEAGTACRRRIVRFESMEPRRLLTADLLPIQVGAVFYEDDSGEDQGGDLVEITFHGGASGTQLEELLIDTDKHGDGLTGGDPFFDTEVGESGVFGAHPLTLLDRSGIDRVEFSLIDGGTFLRFTFEGFDPGEKLAFSFDVDEKGFLNASAVTEGEEFEGSKLSATFSAPYFFDASGTEIFLDFYDTTLIDSGLDLPLDSYVPPNTEDHPVRTAGAIFAVNQQRMPSSLAGTVFEDLDADNLLDPDEPGLSEVTVSLLQWDGTDYVGIGLTTQTDLNGAYHFQDVSPGTYRIAETQPIGLLSVGASAGTVDGLTRGLVTDADTISEITLYGGEASVENDFGEVRPASIGGFVYHDADHNGQRASSEAGIQDVTVQVMRVSTAGPRQISTTTDEEGAWRIDHLVPGIYHVTELHPVGYLDGLDSVGTIHGKKNGTVRNPGDAIRSVRLRAGDSGIEYNFGEQIPASIAGRVFVDQDNDGTYDPTEPLLQDVSIHLLDARGNRQQTVQTDQRGEYLFDQLIPALYGIEEIQPDDYLDGVDSLGSEGGSLRVPDTMVDILLGSGVKATGYDFSELESASLSGSVYEDANLSGSRDKGEMGIANVELMLLDSQGNPTGITTRTDQKGSYRFDKIAPGTYGVAETQPVGYLDGVDTPGTAGGTAENPGDRITGATLEMDTIATSYDFAEFRSVSITGRVLNDRDGNGWVDPVETPIPNITIHLLDDSLQRIATTTTDENGRYTFDNLDPGVYAIEEIQPEGYFDGKDHPGSEGGTPVDPDTITKIKLLPGTHAEEYLFTEVEPGSLSGHVFQDGPAITLTLGESLPANLADLRDGRLTDDDTPLPGVELILADVVGVPIPDGRGGFRSTVTDEKGYYEFTGLQPNREYSVLERHPADYLDGIDTPGSNGGAALNVSDSGYSTTVSTLQLDTLYQTDAITRIWVGPGEQAERNNFSEVRTNTVPPWIPPPSIPPSDPPVVPSQPYGEPATPFFVYVPAPRQIILTPGFGGGSGPAIHTWHLSVINAGQPRRNSERVEHVARIYNAYFNPEVWSENEMNRAQWKSVDPNGQPIMEAVYGLEGGIPLAGDFNGDGVAEIAVFFDGLWFIDLNGNGIWDEGDLWVKLGKAGDLPVVGDWDGDGKDDVGIYGPAWIGDARAIMAEPGLPDVANAPSGQPKNVPPDPEDATVGRRTMKRTVQGAVRSDVIDHVFKYGTGQDIAIAGDFNGDGVSNIGLFREGSWYLDIDGNGRWSRDDIYIESLGESGDLPVVGDFNGDGIDDLGVFRYGTWHLDTNGDRVLDARDRVFELGSISDQPVVADFDGDGIDDPTVYHEGQPPATHREASRAEMDSSTQLE